MVLDDRDPGHGDGTAPGSRTGWLSRVQAEIGTRGVVVFGLLTLLFMGNVVSFNAVEAAMNQQYSVLEPYWTDDVVEVHAQRDDLSGAMFELPWTVGELAPDAVLIVPRDVMRPDLTFAARLDAFGQVAELRSVDVGDEWRNWVDQEAILANVVAERPDDFRASLPAWIIALDPDGDHSELVFVRLEEGDGSHVDVIAESSLLTGGPA